MPTFNLVDFNGAVISQFYATSQQAADVAAAQWGTAQFFSDDPVPAAPVQTIVPTSALVPSNEGTIVRLILDGGPGRVDTGATYPGCSQSNPGACVPMQFANVEDAFQYAADHGEEPIIVEDVETVWGIVEGRIPVPRSPLTPAMIGFAALGLSALLIWRRKK